MHKDSVIRSQHILMIKAIRPAPFSTSKLGAGLVPHPCPPSVPHLRPGLTVCVIIKLSPSGTLLSHTLTHLQLHAEVPDAPAWPSRSLLSFLLPLFPGAHHMDFVSAPISGCWLGPASGDTDRRLEREVGLCSP